MSSSAPVRRDASREPSPRSRTPDAAIVRRLFDGDRDALTEIYAGHAAAALALAEDICGASAARDVVDEAFLALWRGMRRRQPLGVGGLSTQLLDLTRRRALARLNDGDTVYRRYPEPESVDRVSLIALAEEPARAAVARLAPAERHCVEMTYLQGRSIAEIASSSRLPASAVSDRLRRGMREVRRHLPPTRPADSRKNGAPPSTSSSAGAGAGVAAVQW